MPDITTSILIALVGIGVVLIVRYVASCYKDFDPDIATYIVMRRAKFHSVLRKPTFLCDPMKWIFREKGALTFNNLSLSTGDNKPIALLNHRTGKVDLSVQHYTQKFTAHSKEGIELTVTATVPISLDRELLRYTVDILDFDSALYILLSSSIQSVIGRHFDNDIANNLSDINDEITSNLRERTEAFKKALMQGGDINAYLPLGINFRNVSCDVRKVSKPATIIERSASGLVSPMAFSKERLDELRDVFLRDNKNGMASSPDASVAADSDEIDKANQALLEILKLHVQQNIAEALVNSGSLMVLSTDDLGLSGNLALREPLRNMTKLLNDHMAKPLTEKQK